jgi:chromosome segregation ATPase
VGSIRDLKKKIDDKKIEIGIKEDRRNKAIEELKEMDIDIDSIEEGISKANEKIESLKEKKESILKKIKEKLEACE